MEDKDWLWQDGTSKFDFESPLGVCSEALSILTIAKKKKSQSALGYKVVTSLVRII